MVKLTPEQLQHALKQPKHIRNVSVIAHVDHGKTTLTDSLLSRAGVLASQQAGTKRATDTRKDEQQRGISIKSTPITLYLEPSGSLLEGEESGFLVNLVDCPGHVDFSSEVTAALRITDGALVVVDCVSGVCVQTETVLRQALRERVSPVLVLNKLDRCVLEKQMEYEDLYLALRRTISDVNVIVQTYGDEDSGMGEILMDPVVGNVSFASGLHGWGFTLPQMAALYAERQGVAKEKLMSRLWGEHFYNPETGKWSKTKSEGSVRGFNKFVLEPLYKILHASSEGKMEETVELAGRVGVTLTSEEQKIEKGKDLMKAVMKKWLPAGEAMLALVALHLPSPLQAQRYRTDILYEGPLDDDAAQGIKTCDKSAPLMVYVSKMVPSSDKGRFFALGRIFSGSIGKGDSVRILTPNYIPSNPHKDVDVFVRQIPSVSVLVGGQSISVGRVPCGNLVGISGIDKVLVKSGTVTTYEQAHNMTVMKFSVSPVVRVAVEPTKPADLPRLLEGLKRLAKSDPMVQVTMEGGQNVIAGAGELHLEICLSDLEEHAGVPIKKSDPLVAYKETVTEESLTPCLAKSANKHNRVYITAQPMSEGLAEDIEQGKVSHTQDSTERARYLADNYGYEAGELRKLWCFGPEGRGPNFLVDRCSGVAYLQEIKDTVVAGFQWAISEGPLCEESMRGVRFDLVDAMVHRDPACRKGGQLIPASRRAVLAAFLTATPKLLEPIFLVEIQCPSTCVGSVYSCYGPRRGKVISEVPVSNTPLTVLKAYLPVNESFGFVEALRGQTGGQAFPQCVFDHWGELPGDPRQAGSKAASVVQEVRTRRGLHPEIQLAEYYMDKL